MNAKITSVFNFVIKALVFVSLLLLQGCFDSGGGADDNATLGFAPFTSTIALSQSGAILGAVNNAHTVSFFRTSNNTRIAEVVVGNEASHIAFHPNGNKAYVTNAADSTVSIINLTNFTVTGTIDTPAEPRGILISPNGSAGYIVGFFGTVRQFDPSTDTFVRDIDVGFKAKEAAMTNDGDTDDADETLYIVGFYSRLIPGGGGQVPITTDHEGTFGIITAVTGAASATGTIAPLAASGFTEDRGPFCIANAAVNDTFCEGADPAHDAGVFFNQGGSPIICGTEMLIPAIGADPEPPVSENTNIQALIAVVDTTTNLENAAKKVNVNAEIPAEANPGKAALSGTENRARSFMGDMISVKTFGEDCASGVALSRSNDYVMFGTVGAGAFTINPPTPVRVSVGKIPTGMVVNNNGGANADTLYVNNSIDGTISVIDLATQAVTTTIVSKDLPAPGTPEHMQRIGKFAFFTGFGLPADDILDDNIRDIPLERNRASADGWSSCASCHPDGNLVDAVTWIFATGPRQTVPLDGTMFGENNHRILNWNGVRGSFTDFNNNARNVQGGEGFAGLFDGAGEIAAPAGVFNHGATEGISEALDAMTAWASVLRAVNVPQAAAADIAAGRIVFTANCASCHGGPKWTSSQRDFYIHNPTFFGNPLAGGVIRDGNVANAGPQIISVTDPNDGANILTFINDIGTFLVGGPFEIRGLGAIGTGALGGIGFNNPSLMSIIAHAPFGYDGRSATLAAHFAEHGLGGGTIATVLTAQEQADLIEFIRSIDSRTLPIDGDAEAFKIGAAT